MPALQSLRTVTCRLQVGDRSRRFAAPRVPRSICCSRWPIDRCTNTIVYRITAAVAIVGTRRCYSLHFDPLRYVTCSTAPFICLMRSRSLPAFSRTLRSLHALRCCHCVTWVRVAVVHRAAAAATARGAVLRDTARRHPRSAFTTAVRVAGCAHYQFCTLVVHTRVTAGRCLRAAVTAATAYRTPLRPTYTHAARGCAALPSFAHPHCVTAHHAFGSWLVYAFTAALYAVCWFVRARFALPLLRVPLRVTHALIVALLYRLPTTRVRVTVRTRGSFVRAFTRAFTAAHCRTGAHRLPVTGRDFYEFSHTRYYVFRSHRVLYTRCTALLRFALTCRSSAAPRCTRSHYPACVFFFFYVLRCISRRLRLRCAPYAVRFTACCCVCTLYVWRTRSFAFCTPLPFVHTRSVLCCACVYRL